MKKTILFFAMLLLLDGTAFAQRGLNTYPVFRGKVVPTERMVTTEVRGGGMTTYKLDYYRGISFRADTATALKVAALVAADAEIAVSCETEKEGELLTYALIVLKPDRKGLSGRSPSSTWRDRPRWRICIQCLKNNKNKR